MELDDRIEGVLRKFFSGINGVLALNEIDGVLLEAEIELERLSRAISKSVELLNQTKK